MIRRNSASILQGASRRIGYGASLRSALEGDQRDSHLDRGATAMEADELSRFRRLLGAGEDRRVTKTADDDVADPRQGVGEYGHEKPSRHGVVAAAHVGPPSQQL